MKQLLKKMAPPIAIDAYHVAREGRWGIRGRYQSFAEAEAYLKAHGMKDYASESILARVYESVEKVRRGEAAFERDGVVFDAPDYNYPLLTALMYTLSHFVQSGGADVLDFGGSLGSTYFQNRKMLEGFPYRWHIVEQPNFVRLGQEKIPEITFHETVENYVDNVPNDVVMLSSVIQYFDDPYAWLDRILSQHFRYVIIDRTLFSPTEEDYIGIQYVPAEIYEGQYPIFLMTEAHLLERTRSYGYEVLDAWDSFDEMPVWRSAVRRETIRSKGFLMEHRA